MKIIDYWGTKYDLDNYVDKANYEKDLRKMPCPNATCITGEMIKTSDESKWKCKTCEIQVIDRADWWKKMEEIQKDAISKIPFQVRMVDSVKPALEKMIDKLANHIKLATKNIKIFAGEFSPFIYNDDKIKRTLEEKIKEGVCIKAIVGPVIAVDDDTKENTMITLWKEEKIKLYYRQRRGLYIHYRIIDDKLFYGEDYHSAGALADERCEILLSEEEKKEWAQKYSLEFDKLVKEKEVMELKNLDDILLVPIGRLRECYQHLSKDARGFNYLEKEAIEKFCSL